MSQVEECISESDLKPEKGRASLVRLQAATSNTEVPIVVQVSNLSPVDTSDQVNKSELAAGLPTSIRDYTT